MEDEKNNFLMLGEHFYSVQGEGASCGVPSYFIRFAGCNLNCGGKDGSKLKSGEATWHCDSEVIWSKPNKITYSEIIKQWDELGITYDILSGNVHIIFTGGEPLLPHNLKQIKHFLKYLDEYTQSLLAKDNKVFSIGGFFHVYSDLYHPYIEVETNGTQIVDKKELKKIFSQINCSPKLSNSGNATKLRNVEQAIRNINAHNNSYFKIVIDGEKDLQEFITDFILPYQLDQSKIILMPAMTLQSEFFEKTKMVFELAKKYKVCAIPRMHIAAWDKVTGV